MLQSAFLLTNEACSVAGSVMPSLTFFMMVIDKLLYNLEFVFKL